MIENKAFNSILTQTTKGLHLESNIYYSIYLLKNQINIVLNYLDNIYNEYSNKNLIIKPYFQIRTIIHQPIWIYKKESEHL